MNVFIDAVCPTCGREQIDVWVERGGALPSCHDRPMERLWRTAPGITPQGTRAERGSNSSQPTRVSTKAIAVETMQEIDQKMLRYSDPAIAEQHISREVNAHLATPLPTQAPLTLARET